ncbi:MAG: hypothetical protein R2688_00235 [Fimbriimonadaceae bacterium]
MRGGGSRFLWGDVPIEVGLGSGGTAGLERVDWAGFSRVTDAVYWLTSERLALGFAAIVVAILGIGAATFKSWDRSLLKFDGRKNLGVVALFGLLLLFPLVASLSPSTTMDWDSIAYHLAVPKMWMQDGQIHKVLNLHHSNFPFSIDNLYIWGLALGGEAGAKAFSFAILVFGVLAVYGTARRCFPDSQFAGLAAGLIFAGSPVVLWESGTAYIDVAHGLYAGLGVFCAW